MSAQDCAASRACIMSREEQSKDGSFSENPQAFSSSFVGADAHIGPLGSCEFAEGFRKNRCILRADRVVRPYRENSVVVGADDSVGPSGSCEFAADFRKNGAICRGDVGIGPYNHTHKRVQIHRNFPKKSTASCRAEQSPAPTRSWANSYCLSNFECRAFPQNERISL